MDGVGASNAAEASRGVRVRVQLDELHEGMCGAKRIVSSVYQAAHQAARPSASGLACSLRQCR